MKNAHLFLETPTSGMATALRHLIVNYSYLYGTYLPRQLQITHTYIANSFISLCKEHYQTTLSKYILSVTLRSLLAASVPCEVNMAYDRL